VRKAPHGGHECPGTLGIRLVDGKEQVLSTGPIQWAFVDPLFIGLPLARLATFIVSALTAKLPAKHIECCFAKA
jgi:hypothetical protein